jgi:hypothetical protein
VSVRSLDRIICLVVNSGVEGRPVNILGFQWKLPPDISGKVGALKIRHSSSHHMIIQARLSAINTIRTTLVASQLNGLLLFADVNY